MKKKLLVGIVCALSMNASANIVYSNATVTFGGVNPDYDVNSLLTSALLEGINANDLANTGLGGINNSGLFVETFDKATSLGSGLGTNNPFSEGTTDFNSEIGDNTSCALNSSGGGVATTGSLNIREDNVGGLAVIGYNDNCYGYTPEDGSRSGIVNIDYNPILAAAGNLTGAEMGMDYIGFYWATIDTYNTFTFINDGLTVLTLTGTDIKNHITDLNLGRSGQYVNVFFNNGVYFDELQVDSTRRAAEFDNIVNRIVAVQVPEPSTLVILSLGLMGLGARRFKN